MFPPPPPWAHSVHSIGVTGTNGKTTTTTYLAYALAVLAAPVLRVTTVGSYLDQEKLTVSADYSGFIEAMEYSRHAGAKHAVLECTSEALAVGFAKAWPISMGVFTNLTRDHFDGHGSAEHYLASKAQLFLHLPRDGVAILNAYDSASSLLAEIIPTGVRIVTYGLPSRSSRPPVRAVDLTADHVEIDWSGTHVKLRASERFGEVNRMMHLRAIGDVYAENALAALAAAVEAGVPLDAAVRALERAHVVPGRFEVYGNGPRGVVDYGHSPDALERTLRTARKLCPGKLVVVFGAGGGRDRGKREPMGRAAAIADRVLITTDNPRNEDPALIAAEIQRGLEGHSAVEIILDREAAILSALSACSSDDVVVVAGRGPETMQVWGAETRWLADADVVRRALNRT
ncbi:MAG TPA: UDP-N-acetylmuramyl-tripeptide synthetase [Polyangium sp.]|nr:UDP-N-acetylmuramyl-tripeptide synthetase [Polyangium sp.]